MKKSLAIALILLLMGAARVGDRLVVSVNSLPYTQRQVEAYATLREALRPNADGSREVVVAANWRDVLEMFAEEMIILQEAQRLGGFQADAKAMQRVGDTAKERIKQGAAVRATLARLGYDEAAALRVVDQIVRVAAFRKNKERVAAGGGDGTATATSTSTTNTMTTASAEEPEQEWLEDLKNRAVVRYYKDAQRFVPIQPPLRSGGK